MNPFKDDPPRPEPPPPIIFGDCPSPPYKKPVYLHLFGLEKYIAVCDGDDTERLEIYRRIFAEYPTVEYYEPNDTLAFFTESVRAFINGDFDPQIPFFDGFFYTDAYKLCFVLPYVLQILMEFQVTVATALTVGTKGEKVTFRYTALTGCQARTLFDVLSVTGQSTAQAELLAAALATAGIKSSAENTAGLAVTLTASSFLAFEEEETAALGQKEMHVIVETANEFWRAYA